MHQVVYNSYQGLKTGDFTRILEHTDPQEGIEQVKRMAVHNDIFLVFLAPFYFIHDGPETLLVMQSVILGLGAYFVFWIAQHVLKKLKYSDHLALILAFGYLLYPPLQKANNFDFHAVTLATTFLLAMYYFWLKKKYVWSVLFAVMSMLTKEQVGLTVAFFGAYTLYSQADKHHSWSKWFTKYFFHRLAFQNCISFIQKKRHRFGITLIIAGVFWVLFSMQVIIPYFSGGGHFGSKYFRYLIESPWQFFPVLFRYESLKYISILLFPVGFISLFSPLQLLIATPEMLMNLLAENSNMRNIYFHYDAVITPFVFISAIYGVRTVLTSKLKTFILLLNRIAKKVAIPKRHMRFVSFIRHHPEKTVMVFLGISIVATSLYMSPIPWGHHRDLFPFMPYPKKYGDVQLWKKYLNDDSLKVSTTGHLAPHFTSRRYFYNFAEGYDHADYVVIDRSEISRGFQSELKKLEYQRLLRDFRYIKVYDVHGIEVFKQLSF